MATALGVYALVLVEILALAVIHKGRILKRGDSAGEPLMSMSPWRRSHASVLLSLAGLWELTIIVFLLILPTLGFISVALLTVGYAFALNRLPHKQPCNCFGSMLQAKTKQAAITRNVILSSSSIAALAFSTFLSATPEPLGLEALSYALVPTAMLAGLGLLQLVPSNPTAATSIRGGRLRNTQSSYDRE